MIIEKTLSAVAIGSGAAALVSGGITKLVNIDSANAAISRARLSRVDQKIAQITERLETVSLSSFESHQLQTARDNFRFQRNEFTNKLTIHVRRS